MIDVSVDIPGVTQYPVYIGNGILSGVGSIVAKRCPTTTYVVITDSTVSQHYSSNIADSIERFGQCHVLEFEAGESNKTRNTWSSLTDQMIDARVGRDAVVIALGGGVVGDVAGFVAATYHRGLRYVQVPTSLLAMVDSSVGGKTGVDTDHGKNLVGSFHQPQLVIADTATLETLSDGHLTAGMAEALKHGAIADSDYFYQLGRDCKAVFGREPAALEALIKRSVEIKASVVRADEKESGKRAILNFGHSVGHGIEAVSGFSLLHGEAVAIGMVIESQIGEALKITQPGTADTLANALLSFGLPVRLPQGQSVDKIIETMTHDKKNRSGLMRFSTIESIGNIARTNTDLWTFEVPEHLLRSTLSAKPIS